MRFRKLRIAWSVVWGVMALLLVVLWIKSYWWAYTLIAHDRQHEFGVGIENGQLGAAFTKIPKLSRLHFSWSVDAVAPDSDVQTLFGFYFGTHPLASDTTLVLIPLWLVIALVVATGVFFWRCSWAFSLRTLLIATTLVATVLGLVVWAAK